MSPENKATYRRNPVVIARYAQNLYKISICMDYLTVTNKRSKAVSL